MPSFDIVRKWDPPESYRAQAVKSQFTLHDVKLEKRFKGTLNIGKNWQIGVIVGRSGTGKTTIAKELFTNEYIRNLQYTAPTILDDFDSSISIRDITKLLCSVGFASPPDWLKKYEHLSQGEKMRVDIARALSLKQNLIVFDEFTSVVDRNIAQIASFAISKAIRKTNKKFIAVTCHYDVIDWLEPDWVFSTDKMVLLKKNGGALKSALKSLDANSLVGRSLGTIII